MTTVDIEEAMSLVAYLRRGDWIESGEHVRARVLHGGVSNKTVLVEHDGQQWVLKQALAKLRVPADWFSDPMRIHREASALRWLPRLLPAGAIPRLIFEDTVDHVLCMEAVAEPHVNWKEQLLAGRIDQRDVIKFATLIGEIHRGSAELLDDLQPEFGGREFFESLRLEPYYLHAAEVEPRAASFLQQLVEETRTVAATLTHGDFSPKNVLIHDGRLTLLDFEVAHIGDPAFDIGFSLTHLLSKAHHLPDMRTELMLSASDFWNAYVDTVGGGAFMDGLEERAVRHACGCLLARVRGRSQLEYLSDAEKDRQATIMLAILPGPQTIGELADMFADALAG